MCNSGQMGAKPEKLAKDSIFLGNLGSLGQKKQSINSGLGQGFKVRHQDDTNSV